MPIVIGGGAYIPPLPPATATSSDGKLKATLDTIYGGVLLVFSFPNATQPYKVGFLRDGVPVRSGNLAWAPGGYAVAYDHEAPLGAASSWTAQRYFRQADGSLSTQGAAPSTPAALYLSDVDTTFDFWIKSITNPNLSMRVRSQIPDPSFAQTGRNTLADVPQSPVFAGSWDVRLQAARSLTFMTETREERDAFLTLLGSGQVLVQSLRLYGIYDFYALPGDSNEEYLVGAYDPHRVHTVSFIPIARPGTAGAPLYIPGRSYNDVDATYTTYNAVDAALPTYLDWVKP